MLYEKFWLLTWISHSIKILSQRYFDLKYEVTIIKVLKIVKLDYEKSTGINIKEFGVNTIKHFKMSDLLTAFKSLIPVIQYRIFLFYFP